MKIFSAILSFTFFLFFISCSKKEPLAPVKVEIEDYTGYHRNAEVSKLYFNDPNGVNIIVLGDGYIKEDLKIGGAYDSHVKRGIDYLFTVEPFKQYKRYFNTYVVYSESKERGVNKNTVFSSTLFPSSRGIFSSFNSQTFDYYTSYYAEQAVPKKDIDVIILLVNDPARAGSANFGIAKLTTHPGFEYTLVHEVGHAFGGLGDEYVEQSKVDQYSQNDLNYFTKYYPNLDSTNDLKKVKWAHFLDKSTNYQNIVGAFEGGFYSATGVYRPESNSLMGANSYLNFNAPSREAIVKRIDQIMGIPFDFDNFLKDDVPSIQPVIYSFNVNMPMIKNDFIGMEERIKIMQTKKK